jgi:hypothetical protein
METNLKKQQSITINILQSYVIKTNLKINLLNLINGLNVPNEDDDCIEPTKYRSGTILSMKYKNIIKGRKYFKSDKGFKNVCHLIICYNIDRKKKLLHVKVTATGNFQIFLNSNINAEKVVYKIFSIFEKVNKALNIFTTISKYRLELLIVPTLKNCMLKLNHENYDKFFKNSKGDIIQKFIDCNYLSFMIPNDPAIIIKDPYEYKEFKNHPLRYIIYTAYSQKILYINYESYTSLLTNTQKQKAIIKKYVTLRLFSTGNILVSGFNEIVVNESIKKFLSNFSNIQPL